MALSLFGFTIGREDRQSELKSQSFITPVSEDGTSTVSAGGYFGTYVDIDASARSESELISRYRDISTYPDVDNAIEEIVTEGIAAVDSEDPVTLDLEKLELSDSIKKKIRDEFDEVISLLDFKDKAHDIFRRWYIDGRLYYQKVINPANTKQGIQELRYIDPRKIRRIKNFKKGKNDKGIDVVVGIEEFYIYNDKGINENTSQGVKLSTDSVIYCPSGMIDQNSNTMLGYLHKAIKPVNQLKMIEDALVIYRVSRAPERRIFYIDVGNLPKLQAEQYVNDIMNKYRNKVVYDANTGEIRDDRKHLSMMEDFWMPRREGGKGTEITTLNGGQNLGQIEDINYFQNKLYQCLNVPVSRMKADQGFSLGRSNEITRDEVKFNKFIERIRRKFSTLFSEALRVQLVAKQIIRPDEWDQISQDIRFDFQEDNHFAELKDSEILSNRINVLNMMQPYLGTFYSIEFVKRHVLKQSEEDIEDIQKQMDAEQDQMQAMMTMQGGMPVDGGMGAGPNPPGLPPPTPQNKPKGEVK